MAKQFPKTLIFTISILYFFHGIQAQEKKWNAEINYAVVPADGFGGKDNVVDIGFKRRFFERNFFKLGLGLNAGFFNSSLTLPSQFNDNTNYILQPRVFSEFEFPFLKRVNPFLGIGYSNILTRGDVEDSFWGFNANIGLTYDFYKNWLIQLQYDYVSLSAVDGLEGFNNIRLGLGYRF